MTKYNKKVDLELFAEELTEELHLTSSPASSFLCASSFGSASCPVTSAATAGTVSTVG